MKLTALASTLLLASACAGSGPSDPSDLEAADQALSASETFVCADLALADIDALVADAVANVGPAEDDEAEFGASVPDGNAAQQDADGARAAVVLLRELRAAMVAADPGSITAHDAYAIGTSLHGVIETLNVQSYWSSVSGVHHQNAAALQATQGAIRVIGQANALRGRALECYIAGTAG